MDFASFVNWINFWLLGVSDKACAIVFGIRCFLRSSLRAEQSMSKYWTVNL